VSFPLVTPIAPLDGQLVAATSAGSNYARLHAIDAEANLVTVDTATGSVSLVGALGIEPQQRVSLAADPGTGALFAIVGDSNCLVTLLYSVDPATGLATYAETVYAASAEAAVTHDDADRAARSVLERLRAHKHPVNRQQGTLTRPATDAEIVDAVAATWRQLRAADSADGRLMRMFGILR